MREALSTTFGFKPMLKPFDPIGSGGFRPRYEHAPIHLLTTAALRSLSRELPDSVIDTRRFRPNILVDWPDEDEAMPEKDWIGREIRIGEVVFPPNESIFFQMAGPALMVLFIFPGFANLRALLTAVGTSPCKLD